MPPYRTGLIEWIEEYNNDVNMLGPSQYQISVLDNTPPPPSPIPRMRKYLLEEYWVTLYMKV